jgi:hypothetical protein
MKNPKYIYEVELEQITPYVNEIDGEKGKDILRPTEFKPRFDKFLVRKYEEAKKEIPKILLLKVNGENKKENEEILSDKETKKGKSFDYSITIASDDLEYIQREVYKKFMTSKGDGYQVRKKNIKLKILFFSLNLKMIEIIKENLPEFLATTNFGKRKNKCFGSFYISQKDPNYKDIDEIEVLKTYKFFKIGTENKEYLELKEDKLEEILKNLEFKAKTIFSNGKEGNVEKVLIILRIDGVGRSESLGIMKILKTKNDKYRLYFIPNFELIKELIKEKEVDKIKKTNEKVEYIGTPVYKPEEFDYESFDNYIKEMKGE